MAGQQMSFADMVAMARQGPTKGSTPACAKGSTPTSPSPPRQETNPQTPLVDLHPGGDLEGPHQKIKRRRADASVCDGALNLSEGVPDQSKKKRHGKECRAKSPNLRLDKLAVVDYDRYREDSLEAAIDVFKAASKQLKKSQKEEEERFAELKVKRDEALGQAKEAKDALEEAEGKVNILKEELQELKLAKEAAEAKMRKELQDLKLAKETVDRKIEEFEGSVSKLEGEVEDLKQVTKAAEKAKEDAKEYVKTVAHESVRIAKEQFTNALEQVQFCNPGLVVNKTIVDANHNVLGDRIVRPRGRPDGTSLVIYQRP